MSDVSEVQIDSLATALDQDLSLFNFEMRGVKVSLLSAIRDLARLEGGDWTVGRISNVIIGTHEILKEDHRWGAAVDKTDTLTFGDQMSLIDVLKTHHKDASNLHPTLGVCYDDVVGAQATKFCSFAYNGDFFDLVDSLEALVLANPEYADDYFWFDMLVNNQWIALDHDFQWWATTFKTAVRKIGHLVLICSPWSDPEPLKRAWCLWEIYCALENDVKFDVALGANEHTKFIDAIIADPTEYYQMLGNIDVQKSHCYLAYDKLLIFEAVEQTIGFAQLNTMVIDKMKQWVFFAMDESIKNSSPDAPRENLWDKMLAKGSLLNYDGDSQAAMEIFEQCLSDFADIEDGARLGKTIYWVGTMYWSQGKLPKALEYLERALPMQVLALGEFHTDVAFTLEIIGFVYKDQGRYEDAIENHHKCLGIRVPRHGELHPDVAASYGNIATVYCKQRKHEEALAYFQRSLAIELQNLGDKHPNVATTYSNIGTMLHSQHNFKKALEVFEKALNIRLQTLGEDHPDTKDTVKWIGSIRRLEAM